LKMAKKHNNIKNRVCFIDIFIKMRY
jgi:hypothetical protein